MLTHDLSYFLVKTFLVMMVFKICTDYVISWELKGEYTSKVTPFYTAFLHNIKPSEYRTGMQFNNSVLVVEQNIYATRIVNVYISYDLDHWPKILL